MLLGSPGKWPVRTCIRENSPFVLLFALWNISSKGRRNFLKGASGWKAPQGWARSARLDQQDSTDRSTREHSRDARRLRGGTDRANHAARFTAARAQARGGETDEARGEGVPGAPAGRWELPSRTKLRPVQQRLAVRVLRRGGQGAGGARISQVRTHLVPPDARASSAFASPPPPPVLARQIARSRAARFSLKTTRIFPR